MPNRPERMWRRGRPVISVFQSGEWLYHRCIKDHLNFSETELLASVSVRLPNFSVNRESFSQPEDVLIPPLGEVIENIDQMGIIGFQVEVVTWQTDYAPPMNNYNFTVVHDPRNDNYSHSEVRAELKKEGPENTILYEYEEKLKLNRTASKEYRARIARQARIFLRPSI